MRTAITLGSIGLTTALVRVDNAQRYLSPDGRVRVPLADQPLSPTGTSLGPNSEELARLFEMIFRH